MKRIALFTVFASLSVAQAAEVRTPVSLSSLSLQNGQLEYVYRTGGGCADHRGEANLTFKFKTTDGRRFIESAKLEIVDVASNEDYCEALISVDGKIDLQALLNKKLDEAGFPGRTVQLSLPTVSIAGE